MHAFSTSYTRNHFFFASLQSLAHSLPSAYVPNSLSMGTIGVPALQQDVIAPCEASSMAERCTHARARVHVCVCEREREKGVWANTRAGATAAEFEYRRWLQGRLPLPPSVP